MYLIPYIIIIIKVILGNNIQIYNSKYLLYFTTFYCAFVAFLLCFNYFWDFDYSHTDNFLVAEYIFIVVFHLITREKYIHFFFDFVMINDTVMGVKNVSLISNLVFTFFILTGAGRIFIAYLRWYSSLMNNVALIVFATDLNHITGTLVYSCLYARMKYIKKTLANNFVSVNIVSKEKVNRNVKIVRKCLRYYHNLLDTSQHVDKEMQGLILLALMCNFPSWVMKISTAVKTCIQEGDSQLILIFALETLLSVVLVTSPALVIELVCSEIDEIRATLVRQLIRCPDESLCFELETALQYVRVRPFRLVICGAVPVDINLPFVVSALCITYVIVIMQFTHFSSNSS